MNDILTLSPQEKKILIALSFGSLYKEIANDYNISINTVKKHLKSIYRKLDVHKRTTAVQKFLEAAPQLGQLPDPASFLTTILN
jgi:DNA-binding NarL/FixJ family response regulator